MAWMARDPNATRVIFRTYPDGDVVAILLDVPANPGCVVCYQRIGQHAEGHYSRLIEDTRAATPEEFTSLRRELEGKPYEYRLDLRRRWWRRGRGRLA
jgi:hypothetical protein